jgi:hypothetical protein
MKIALLLEIVGIAVRPTLGRCDALLVQHLPANRIEQACSLVYAVENESAGIGSSNRALDLTWVCRDVKWQIKARGEGIFAAHYVFYAYRYCQNEKSISIDRDIVDKLGEGWEGVTNGISVNFP